jgi:hypothetical protein
MAHPKYKVSARAEMTTEGEELVWFGTLVAMKVFRGPHTVQHRVW